MATRLKAVDGDLKLVDGVPPELVERYRTAFGIDAAVAHRRAARRGKWIDQSQSLNLFLPQPDLKAMSHMYRRAWRVRPEDDVLPADARGVADRRADGGVALAAAACSIEAARNGEECEACQ